MYVPALELQPGDRISINRTVYSFAFDSEPRRQIGEFVVDGVARDDNNEFVVIRSKSNLLVFKNESPVHLISPTYEFEEEASDPHELYWPYNFTPPTP